MSKGKRHKRKAQASGVRKPRIPKRLRPAVIKAYSGSGYHSPAKYGHQERRAADREIRRELD